MRKLNYTKRTSYIIYVKRVQIKSLNYKFKENYFKLYIIPVRVFFILLRSVLYFIL